MRKEFDMFGYVTINEQELKVKHYNTYRGFYCGQCKRLQSEYGLSGKITLNYDLTFLAILLTGLYEEHGEEKNQRCVLHPMTKMKRVENTYIDYAADMTILLAYYQCVDHWMDDKNPVYRMEGMFLRRNLKYLKQKYPRQFHAVVTYMKKQAAAEKRKESDLDIIAGITGELLSEIFIYKKDEWSEILKDMGFYLGKFIYLMDAYEDIEKDEKKGHYNPFLIQKRKEDFEVYCYTILTEMMAACARKFELLPILVHEEILKNILYSGVWKKYNLIVSKRMKEEKRHESI